MGREKGTLIRWNDAKGFGFIQPDHGKKEIFLHIKMLPHYQRRPKVGDILYYAVETDDSGRLLADPARIKGLALSAFTSLCGLSGILFALYLILVAKDLLPLHIGAFYVLMSLLTIIAYSFDKRAAERQEWRTAEKKLHLLEAFGGWPGALLAQIFYRHKIQKLSYQLIFWTIVVAHGALWFYAFNHPEDFQRSRQAAIANADRLLINAKVAAKQYLPSAIVDLLPTEKSPPPAAENSPHSRLGRSIKSPPQGTRIAEATIKEIRPGVGLIVTFDKGLEGVIHRSTLVPDYAQAFKKGEAVRVAIIKISFENKQNIAEGILVDR
jgi:uncharacterized membrane protein YsdA (DUF1294 family)/cold shock CspA family protein